MNKNILKHLLVWFCMIPVDVYAEDTLEGTAYFTVPYKIEKKYINENCSTTTAQLSDSNQKEFLLALCDFHKNKTVSSFEDDLKAFDLQLNRLIKTQENSISAAQKSLAQLLESFVQCQKAQYIANSSKIERNNVEFCAARRRAQNVISNIDWSSAKIIYDRTAENFSINKITEALAACYDPNQGVLDSSFDQYCWQFKSLDPQQIDTLVSSAYNETELKYFGAGNPITAMFERKKKFAENVLINNRDEVLALQKRSQNLASTVSSGENAQKTLEEQLKFIPKYLEVYAQGNAILARINSWRQGFYIGADGRDFSKELENKIVSLNDQNSKINSDGGLVSESAKLLEHVRKLNNSADEVVNTTKELCKIYYCGLTTASMMVGNRLDNACNNLTGNLLCKIDVQINATSLKKHCELIGSQFTTFVRKKPETALDRTKSIACWGS